MPCFRMKFGKLAMKCRDCRASCHPECKDQVPLPCVPVGNTPTRRGGAMGTIADYTPHTSPMVPSLIVHCINEVELRGLNEVGIYRVPGAEKDVRLLKVCSVHCRWKDQIKYSLYIKMFKPAVMLLFLYSCCQVVVNRSRRWHSNK